MLLSHRRLPQASGPVPSSRSLLLLEFVVCGGDIFSFRFLSGSSGHVVVWWSDGVMKYWCELWTGTFLASSGGMVCKVLKALCSPPINNGANAVCDDWRASVTCMRHGFGDVLDVSTVEWLLWMVLVGMVARPATVDCVVGVVEFGSLPLVSLWSDSSARWW